MQLPLSGISGTAIHAKAVLVQRFSLHQRVFEPVEADYFDLLDLLGLLHY